MPDNPWKSGRFSLSSSPCTDALQSPAVEFEEKGEAAAAAREQVYEITLDSEKTLSGGSERQGLRNNSAL
jgi:hypothetical protein